MKRRRIVRTVEVTIEAEENIVLRAGGNGAVAAHRTPVSLAWCTNCQREVGMITPEQAAAIAGVTARVMYRWLEAGRVHVAQTKKDLLCQESVSNLTTDLDK